MQNLYLRQNYNIKLEIEYIPQFSWSSDRHDTDLDDTDLDDTDIDDTDLDNTDPDSVHSGDLIKSWSRYICID